MSKIKYVLIIMLSTMLNKSVINLFGACYIVAGNVVRRIR